MSQQPRPESRIKSLEERASTIEAKIIEMASDTAEELKAIRQNIDIGFSEVKQELKKMTSFEEVSAYLGHVATKDDIASVKGDISRIEATMATKEDVAALKATQDARFDRIEATQAKQDAKLDTLLHLLQQKSGE